MIAFRWISNYVMQAKKNRLFLREFFSRVLVYFILCRQQKMNIIIFLLTLMKELNTLFYRVGFQFDSVGYHLIHILKAFYMWFKMPCHMYYSIVNWAGGRLYSIVSVFASLNCTFIILNYFAISWHVSYRVLIRNNSGLYHCI